MTNPTDPAQLVALAKPLAPDLPLAGAERLLSYLDAMLVINEQINLTAVRDREQAIVLHALDSLAFARTGLVPHHVLDIGTGNGFPGVGLAALFPRARVVLMDKTGKKIRAIGACLVQSRMANADPLQLDAAQAPALRRELRHAFDLAPRAPSPAPPKSPCSPPHWSAPAATWSSGSKPTPRPPTPSPPSAAAT